MHAHNVAAMVVVMVMCESGTVTSNAALSGVAPTKMDPVEKVHHQVFRSHFEHNKIYFVIAFGVFINHRNTRLDC